MVDSSQSSAPMITQPHPWRSSPVTVKGRQATPQVASVSSDQSRVSNQQQQQQGHSQGIKSEQSQQPQQSQLQPLSQQLQTTTNQSHNVNACIAELNSKAPTPPQSLVSNPSNDHPYQVQLQQQQQTSQSALKLDSEKAALMSLVKRCEYVCKVVQTVVTVGDNMARDAIVQEKEASVSGKQRRRVDSNDGPFASLSGACALYLHCLALLRDSLRRATSISIRLDKDALLTANNN